MITQKALRAVLKAADPISQEHIRNLTEENNELKMKYAKSIKEKAKVKIKISELKIENETYKRSISALQKALDKAKATDPIKIIYQIPKPPNINK